MNPVTRPVASRGARAASARRRGPSHAVPTTARTTGTAMASVGERVDGDHDRQRQSSATTAAPDRSSQTSSTMARSWTSSRNRLTASPGEPGSRPAAGPGVGDQRPQQVDPGHRLPADPAAVPLHGDQRSARSSGPTSMPTTQRPAAPRRGEAAVGSAATRSSTTLTSSAGRAGACVKKVTHPNQVEGVGDGLVAGEPPRHPGRSRRRVAEAPPRSCRSPPRRSARRRRAPWSAACSRRGVAAGRRRRRADRRVAVLDHAGRGRAPRSRRPRSSVSSRWAMTIAVRPVEQPRGGGA